MKKSVNMNRVLLVLLVVMCCFLVPADIYFFVELKSLWKLQSGNCEQAHGLSSSILLKLNLSEVEDLSKAFLPVLRKKILMMISFSKILEYL